MLLSSAIVSLFYTLCLLISTDAVSEGTVRLVQNGVPTFSQAYSAGIAQIYFSGAWGNICDDFDFGFTEADVLCHQLSYSGASTYSNTGITSIYGSDTSTATAIEDVSCLSSSYRSLTQCSFSTPSIFSSCGNNNDVIVTCYTTRIWNSPTAGDIRLTGGIYSNQGLLEIYCNSEWGTVCDDTFGNTDASVACNQLGYNDYNDYDHLTTLTGTVFQDIWLNSLFGCSSSDICLTDCQTCPTFGTSACSHSEDITLECEYDPVSSNLVVRTTSTCDNSDITVDTGSLASGIVAAVIICTIIGIIICILIFTVPICICVCLGVGVGAAARGSPRTTVVAQPTTTTSAAVISTQQTTAQAPPPAGSYPMQQQGYPGPPQQGGYPPQQGGYPPQQGGYPPQQGAGYPPKQGGYDPQQGGYDPQQGGYPPQQGAGYPPQEKVEPPPAYPGAY